MFIPFVAAMSHGRFLLLTIIITLLILSNSPTAVLQRRTKVPTPVLSPSLRLFPLTQTLRALSLPPLPLAGCRVSLCSCHTGPPTLTHGGREKLNAYFVPKIVYVYGRLPFPGKAARWDEAKKKKSACQGRFHRFFLFKCGGTNWITLLTCHIATDGPSK